MVIAAINLLALVCGDMVTRGYSESTACCGMMYHLKSMKYTLLFQLMKMLYATLYFCSEFCPEPSWVFHQSCRMLSQKPALSPRDFADKAGVRYAQRLCPIALCPYVLDYALGGAILSSSLTEWGGVSIKQVSSAQMTHDMVLRPGPLFMASHVSEGWLPWGTLLLLPPRLAFTSHQRPGRHTAEYTHRPGPDEF